MTPKEAKVQVLQKLDELSAIATEAKRHPEAKHAETIKLIDEIKALCVMWGT